VLEGILTRDAEAQPEDAFVRLADKELQRSYRLAGLILGNAHEAEDATQDALLRAWSSSATLRSPTEFQAWFDRILVNVCRDRLRRRRTIRFLPMAAEHEDRPAADPFQELIAQDELLAAMRGLDADLRTVVVLRYWSDLTVDQIAQRIGWRAGTVKSRLHRALSEMRAHLAAQAADRESLQ
jgi:RNA polymerase sigma-70 factor, ECF subfamily